MKANEFIKKHGWDYTRGIIIACESGFLPKNNNYRDLKRLVESWESVESCGGVDAVKKHLKDGNVFRFEETPLMKQAIADVESCQ